MHFFNHRIGAVEVDERDSLEIDNINDLHLARYLSITPLGDK
jgi:CMP-N-acetylneuraminic acid synthetase